MSAPVDGPKLFGSFDEHSRKAGIDLFVTAHSSSQMYMQLAASVFKNYPVKLI